MVGRAGREAGQTDRVGGDQGGVQGTAGAVAGTGAVVDLSVGRLIGSPGDGDAGGGEIGGRYATY